MKKNFVLDTNVLLHDPRSIFGFEDNDVVVPIYVIEEIDNFKRDLSSLGRNARQAARYLDDFRAQGKLGEGVPLGDGKGSIRVLFTDRELPRHLADSHGSVDSKILAVALDVREREKGKPVVFVTPGRGKDTVAKFKVFLATHGGSPGRIVEVVCDMSGAFIAAIGESFDNAAITVDWFHVVQLFTKALDEVRRLARQQPHAEAQPGEGIANGAAKGKDNGRHV